MVWGREESAREQNGSRYLFCPTHYRRPVEHAIGSLSTFLHPSLSGVLVGVFVALITRTCAPPDTGSSAQRQREQGDRICRSSKRHGRSETRKTKIVTLDVYHVDCLKIWKTQRPPQQSRRTRENAV